MPDGSFDWSEPPAGAIDIGDGHAIVKLWSDGMVGGDSDSNVWLGIDEWHRKADGRWCVGYVLFAVREADEWARRYVGGHDKRWQVQSFEPLTISPSIQCRACPSHGYIQGGRWVGA